MSSETFTIPRVAWRAWLPWAAGCAWVVLLMVAIALGERAQALTGEPVVLCHVKRWIGLPCPGCGGLRATAALAHGDFRVALTLNPLVTVGWAAVCVAGVAWLCGWRPAIRCWPDCWVSALLVTGATANWLYLLYDGR